MKYYFLDKDGLAYYDQKIKAYITSHAQVIEEASEQEIYNYFYAASVDESGNLVVSSTVENDILTLNGIIENDILTL